MLGGYYLERRENIYGPTYGPKYKRNNYNEKSANSPRGNNNYTSVQRLWPAAHASVNFNRYTLYNFISYRQLLHVSVFKFL